MPVQMGYDPEEHEITHEPYNPLCDACVRGRASSIPIRIHGKKGTRFPPKERKVPQVDFDFCYLTEQEDFNVSTMLTGVVRWKPDDDKEMPTAFAIPCPSKRATPWLVKQILNELEWTYCVQKGDMKLRIEKGQTVL